MMAEFKDVIKQYKRMCDAMINCGQCPLIDAELIRMLEEDVQRGRGEL